MPRYQCESQLLYFSTKQHTNFNDIMYLFIFILSERQSISIHCVTVQILIRAEKERVLYIVVYIYIHIYIYLTFKRNSKSENIQKARLLDSRLLLFLEVNQLTQNLWSTKADLYLRIVEVRTNKDRNYI